MPTKYKHVYGVYIMLKNSDWGSPFGLQPVKANNKKEARERFKKRYPKRKILDIDRMDDHKFLSKPI